MRHQVRALPTVIVLPYKALHLSGLFHTHFNFPTIDATRFNTKIMCDIMAVLGWSGCHDTVHRMWILINLNILNLNKGSWYTIS